MQTFASLEDFARKTGEELGVTDYIVVTQDMINTFAQTTGDQQWIHTDPERAARDSPHKTTIAHGFLTLSLAPKFLGEIFRIESVKLAINYGLNKVRFTNVVPAGSKLRMHAWLRQVEEPQANEQIKGLKAIIECAFEVEGETKPACVAELITLLYE